MYVASKRIPWRSSNGISVRKPIDGVRCFSFKSLAAALLFVYPLEILYFPLPIRLGTSAIAAAETAANESASKVFSCPAFYNEDKLKICGEMPVYKLNYFSQVIRSFSFQGFPCICGCSGFRFVRMNGGYCFYQSVSFYLK